MALPHVGVTEPTHIDEWVLDLVLTDVPDIVGVRVCSSVGTSDHSAIFIDVVLDQPFLTWYVSRRFI